MKKFISLSLILALFLVSPIIAQTLCDRTSVDVSWNKTDSVNPISVVCHNQIDNTTVTINALGNYFSTTPISPITIGDNPSTIILNFQSDTNVGDYFGYLSFSDGSSPIPINIHVRERTQQDTSGCQINPSLASYNQVVQQGTEIPLPKITFSPNNCIGNMVYDASHIYVEGGIVIGGVQKPVSISSIVSDGVNLNVNTVGLSSQTYQTKLKVNAFSKNFEIPINIIVTGGSGVNGGISETNIPSCSLSSLTLNTNGTYNLVCSLVTDVVIMPRADNFYIIGTGRDDSANQYVWKFKAINTGNTKICADFYYQNSPLGKSFCSDVRITLSGINVGAGTNIRLDFFQKGIKRSYEELGSGETIIFPVDNLTNSAIPTYEIFINGNKISNNTFDFKSGTAYEIRASALSLGYTDLTLSNITIRDNLIVIKINPNAGSVLTLFNITTDVNSTLKINGLPVSNPFYSYLTSGINTIEASKEGYITATTNITVESSAIILSGGADFKKGTNQTFILSQNASWVIYYKKTIEATERNVFTSGNGAIINFVPDKAGVYQIDLDGITKGTYQAQGFDWNTKWGFMAWWLWVLFACLILVVILIAIYKYKSSGSEYPMGFAQTPIRT